MKRRKLAGYLVEIDEERGTFTIVHPWWKNLRDVVLMLAGCVCLGYVGILLCSPWTWTFATPIAEWQWYHALITGTLAILVILIGVVCFVACFGGLYEISLRVVRGFPRVVLDRTAEQCRDSTGRVFPIKGLDSILLAEKDGGEGTVYYELAFQFPEGKPRALDRSSASTRASCEEFGKAIAGFLNVPIRRS